MNEIISSWRNMRIMWRLGLIDVKWLGIFFLATLMVSWAVRELILRRLERRNKVLRVMLEIEAANAELLRLGSTVQLHVEEGTFP